MGAIHIQVFFENEDHFLTWFNGSKEDAEKYYLNRWFNIGFDDDNMQKCIRIEVIKEADILPHYTDR